MYHRSAVVCDETEDEQEKGIKIERCPGEMQGHLFGFTGLDRKLRIGFLFSKICKSICSSLRRTEHSNEPLKTKIVLSKGFHDF